MKALYASVITALRTIGGLATSGLLCALLAVPTLNFFPWAAAADVLPSTAPYLGEIRRDASGRLIVAPAADTASTAGPPVSGTTRILRVGPQQATRSIAEAAALAQDGDTIEIEAGDYTGDVAVWKQHELTIRGVGGRVRLIANGASAEKKAIWVIRGGAITIENIEFSGARVPGSNGAGIRFEQGYLKVRNCRFIDNENGILTSNNPDASLEIEGSEFAGIRDGGSFKHNLYVGAIRKLRVTGSYFHHAWIGHLLKSRAAENHILYNRLTDEADGRASYELEFPNGGIAYVIGNIIEQGKATENQNIVSFGAEGYKHPANELYLINNTLIDRLPESGYFLAVKPGFHIVKAYNNLLLGRRPLNPGIDGEFINNPNVDAASFVLADRHDYRIRRESPLHRSYRSPGVAVSGIDLAPTHEYVHPATTRPLSTTPLLPGARQTLQPDKTPGG